MAGTVVPEVAVSEAEAVLVLVASEPEEVTADMAVDDDNFQEGYI